MQRKETRPRAAARHEEPAAPVEAAAAEARGAELTTSNKILVAALQLDRERDTFFAEDLVVAAWRAYPESFGLNHYRDQYPDANRVLAKLMGSTGLCSRGWLEQLTTRTYRLTAAGRKLAASLRASAPANDTPRAAPAPAPKAAEPVAPVVPLPSPRAAAPAPKPAPAPSPKVEEPPAPQVSAVTLDAPSTLALQRLVGSSANVKFSRGGLVTYADALGFWGVGGQTGARGIQLRLGEIEAVLDKSARLIQSTGQVLELARGTTVTLTTIVGLQGMHRMLLQKFKRELDGLRAASE